MCRPVTNKHKEEKEIDLPDNLNIANITDWNKALSKALEKTITFPRFTLASLDMGYTVVTEDAEYKLMNRNLSEK